MSKKLQIQANKEVLAAVDRYNDYTMSYAIEQGYEA